MSNFFCPKCGTALIDTLGGSYITECEHYPKIEVKQSSDIFSKENIMRALKESSEDQIKILGFGYKVK